MKRLIEINVDFRLKRQRIKQQIDQFILENIKRSGTRRINVNDEYSIMGVNLTAMSPETSHWDHYAQMFNQLTVMERRIIYYRYLSQKTDVYAELNTYYSRSQYFRVKRTAEYEFAYLLGVLAN